MSSRDHVKSNTHQTRKTPHLHHLHGRHLENIFVALTKHSTYIRLKLLTDRHDPSTTSRSAAGTRALQELAPRTSALEVLIRTRNEHRDARVLISKRLDCVLWSGRISVGSE
jgi:hypothetical protein